MGRRGVEPIRQKGGIPIPLSAIDLFGRDERNQMPKGKRRRAHSGRQPAHFQVRLHAKDRVEEACAPCALRDRCQSHCACQHWALTRELGRINASLCEIEESFIATADHVASTLLAESCGSFIATYFRKSCRPAP